MPDLKILTVEDPEQLGILRSKSKKVQQVTPRLVDLAYQMLETMRAANGVGLAAPQVGVLQRFFVAELPEDEENNLPRETYILFNPEIVKGRGEQIGYEGCLSIPGYIGEVARQEQITVKALNENGRDLRLKLEGYLARVFQHEIDHLDGTLYTDRLTRSSHICSSAGGRRGSCRIGGRPSRIGKIRSLHKSTACANRALSCGIHSGCPLLVAESDLCYNHGYLLGRWRRIECLLLTRSLPNYANGDR